MSALMAIYDIAILVILGLCGWGIFALLRLPVPALLGSIVAIGGSRVAGVPLPMAPDAISLLAQIVMGVYIGSKVNRDVLKDMKEMIAPGAIIVTWALAVAFVLGLLLYHFTYLDLFTAILASSMGGLPEMTIIALATHAQVEVVVVMQLFRMVITIIAFPVILKYVLRAEEANKVDGKDEKSESSKEEHQQVDGKRKPDLNIAVNWLGTIFLALAGSFTLEWIGVPAGAMVGSMLIIALASVSGFPVQKPPVKIFKFMLLGIGIVVANNINQETVSGLMAGELIQVAIISAVFIFLSSFLVAYIIRKITSWDFATCFLAAAPGGFSIMAMLAIEYNRDPLRVSLLHLSRLIALKAIIPVVFMFFI